MIPDHAARAGPQRRQLGGQRVGGVPGEPGPDVIGAGQHQSAGLVDGLHPLGAGGALSDHQRPDRLHLPVTALRGAAGTAGLGGAGGTDCIQRIRLSLAAPVLAIGAAGPPPLARPPR